MTPREIIGLVPAAGQATRISPLPFSKELYPIGLRSTRDGRGARPQAVACYLLERMRFAGVRKAFIVLRDGKWDIPGYFNDGTELLNMHLAYLMMRLPFGPPFSLDQAYEFVRDALIVFGFPDILFSPQDVFVRLIEHQLQSNADVVLGVFPCDRPDTDDMIEFDDASRVRAIHIRQPVAATRLQYAWFVATWAPSFTQFMHEYLAAALAADHAVATRREWHVGHVIQAAIEQGLHVNAVPFPDARYLDIGTPESLARLYQTVLDVT